MYGEPSPTRHYVKSVDLHLMERRALGLLPCRTERSKSYWVGESAPWIASAPLTRGVVFEILRCCTKRLIKAFDAPWVRDHKDLHRSAPLGAEADQPEGGFNFVDALRFVNRIDVSQG